MVVITSGTAEVVSWSKDSIFVRWNFDDHGVADDAGSASGGYKIRYQAVGSNIVQVSRLLDISATAYNITHLHENTSYDICVLRMRQPTYPGGFGESSTWSSKSWMTEASACVKGTTSTDSLSVALGSTFGAFLALGLIVALVFVAKWQHSLKFLGITILQEVEFPVFLLILSGPYTVQRYCAACDHRQRIRCTVVAHARINSKMGNLTPCKIVTPENFSSNVCTRDCAGDGNYCANFGANRFSGGFSPSR